MSDAGSLIALIPRLRRYARALVGERAAADDLVQDTLERAWSKLHLYRHGTDLRAWLFTVMHNVHVNQVRASRPTTALDDEMPELAQRVALHRATWNAPSPRCPRRSARCCCWWRSRI